MFVYFEDVGFVNVKDISAAKERGYATHVFLKSGAELTLNVNVKYFWESISKTTPPPPT